MIEHLAREEQDLVHAARELVEERYVEGRHEVGAAVRMASGAVHLGLHVESSIGRASICAEGIAIGAALMAGEAEIDTIAAVLRLPDGTSRVVSPCGLCRELIGDYGTSAHVIDFDAGTVRRVTIASLLPSKTTRRWAWS
jgi:cytidine deaminase